MGVITDYGWRWVSARIEVNEMANDQEISVEERLARAKKPGQDAMKMHPYYGVRSRSSRRHV